MFARSHRTQVRPRRDYARLRSYLQQSRGYALTGSFIYLIAGFNCEKIAVNDTSADARVKYMRARRALPSVCTCVRAKSRRED